MTLKYYIKCITLRRLLPSNTIVISNVIIFGFGYNLDTLFSIEFYAE